MPHLFFILPSIKHSSICTRRRSSFFLHLCSFEERLSAEKYCSTAKAIKSEYLCNFLSECIGWISFKKEKGKKRKMKYKRFSISAGVTNSQSLIKIYAMSKCVHMQKRHKLEAQTSRHPRRHATFPSLFTWKGRVLLQQHFCSEVVPKLLSCQRVSQIWSFALIQGFKLGHKKSHCIWGWSVWTKLIILLQGGRSFNQMLFIAYPFQ